MVRYWDEPVNRACSCVVGSEVPRARSGAHLSPFPTPRARGVEREVLDALANGLDLEEDLTRRASAPAEEPERDDAASNVIPFPRKA